MKKFFKFILFLNICFIIVFSALYFKEEITSFVYAQTGIELKIPSFDYEQLAFWNKFAAPTDKPQEKTDAIPVQQDNSIDLSTEPKENTIMGISYSHLNNPSSMAMHADRIVRIKVKSTIPAVQENIVLCDVKASIKKTYKGKETDEIRFYAYGGTAFVSELKKGQIKETALKTDEFANDVNVFMDSSMGPEQGKEYIVFLSDNNGIITPLCGNKSLFKIEGTNVVSKDASGEEFSMKRSKFEKTYLNQKFLFLF